MKERSTDLNYHGHPCDIQAVQEALLQVIHPVEVYRDEVDIDVLLCVCNHRGVLPKRIQNEPTMKQDDSHGDKYDCVDHAGPIQVNTGQLELVRPKCLRCERLKCAIHAQVDRKGDRFNQGHAKTQPC